MIERFSGEFNRGYTRAIMDIESVFLNAQGDLAFHHKKMTQKIAMQLLHCCLSNREKLREGVDGFIRWNGQKDDFEFYSPEKS